MPETHNNESLLCPKVMRDMHAIGFPLDVAVGAFVRPIEEHEQRMRSDVNSGHFNQLRKTIHMIRGQAKNVGSMRINSICTRIFDAIDARSPGNDLHCLLDELMLENGLLRARFLQSDSV